MDFDARLLAQASVHARNLKLVNGKVVALPKEFLAPATDEPGLQTYWQVDSPQGDVLAISPHLREFRLPRVGLEALPHAEWYHCYFLHRMRKVSLPIKPASGGGAFVLHYAQDHRLHQERLEWLDLALGWGGACLVLGFVAWGMRWHWQEEKRQGRRPVPSILARLLLGLFVLVGAGMVLAGWASYALVQRGWIGQMDQALENRARGVVALCDRKDGRWSLDVAHLDTSIFRDPKSMQYFQVWDHQGRVIGRSASLAHLDLPYRPHVQGVSFDWFHPAYLHRTRTATLATVREGEQLTVCFGQDYRGMKARLRELRSILLAVWGGTLALLGLLLVLLVRISLRPLRRLAAGLERLEAEHLGSFRPVDVPTEARPLLDALVETLRRLETSFRRERSLLSNLAHELRTPLAGLRTTLEVGLPDDEEHARRAMRDSLGITLQIQGVIDSLLQLGRLEAGSLSPRMAPIPLGSILDGFSSELACVKCQIEPDQVVQADPGWMRIVMGNLLENAQRHAGPGGLIRLTARADGGMVRIVLANEGCDLGPEEIERVFDRFWRKDPVRSIESRNAGLGLALCRELVERMGGAIGASVPEPGLFELEIRLNP